MSTKPARREPVRSLAARPARGPGRPPGNTREATRASILRAARSCFATRGFAVATNREIAEGAGVTAAAIYQYFDSKVALYVATAREAATIVTSRMRADASGDGGVVETMAAMVRTLLSVHEHDPSLAAFLATLPAELQRHPELAGEVQLGSQGLPVIMSAVVARGVASGELDAKDAARAAQMFVACMMGLSQYAAQIGDGHGAATAFAELLEGRLFRQPGARKPGRAGDARKKKR
jgi:AcrR family transcriptional regulator